METGLEERHSQEPSAANTPSRWESNISSVSEGVTLGVHRSITSPWGHEMGNLTKSKRLRQDAPHEILIDLVYLRKREIKLSKKSDEAYEGGETSCANNL